MRPEVPLERVRALNSMPVAGDAEYVLYWMVAARRASWNHGLDHALNLADELQKPLVVLEGLRSGYEWASDRHHAFVIRGMRDNERAFEGTGVTYYPYVEPEPDAGKGLLAALAKDACAVVTDDYPCFFIPRMQAAAAGRLRVRVEAVDSNGLLPMRAAPQVYSRAFDLRRFLQRNLASHLAHPPAETPLAGWSSPKRVDLTAIERRWPRADAELLTATPEVLARLPIDHSVGTAPTAGGAAAAEELVQRFLAERLAGYDGDRNHPDRDATSGLSPYLHFGHVSAHRILAALAEREDWELDEFGQVINGSRENWWGMSPSAEAFLDQLATWRELGFNMAAHRPDFESFESLPEWARRTLAEHEDDERPYVYDLAAFEKAETHDEIWNAAQNELRATGRIHNYLRMLWGKKILHWSASPREALRVMVELNNKYALDGRDPNSYSGIFWVLGRYDRAWGPEREVFGKIRYMSSRNTRRKLRLKGYLERWGEPCGMFSAG